MAGPTVAQHGFFFRSDSLSFIYSLFIVVITVCLGFLLCHCLLCCAVICFLSSFAIIARRNRELFAFYYQFDFQIVV